MTSKTKIFELLKIVAPILPAPIYWEDANSVLLGGNESVFKATGAQFAEAYLGKTLFELYPQEMAAHIKRHNEEVMQTEKILSQEEIIEDISTGEVKYFTAIKGPLHDEDGNVIGIIGTSIDITERKKMEEELLRAKIKADAANQAKTKFIANMSHDIRTPLGGVVGMARILEEKLQSPEDKQYAQWIYESGEQLLGLLNGILDIVSTENINENDLREETLDLPRCISDILQLELPSTKLKGINLSMHLDEKIPQFIVSDRTKIHRILLNLLGNAIKFTQTGTVSVDVKYLTGNKKKAHISFSVTDTGIGIPAEHQDKVFDRFFRATPSYKGIYTGHGVGLHIAQLYTQLLGGEIKLSSEEGVGSSFYFDLHLKVSKTGPTPTKIPSQKTLPPQLEKPQDLKKNKKSYVDEQKKMPHILLIEDNEISLHIAEAVVSKAGCRFTSVVNGEEALLLVNTMEFDLIITDIGLPGISGFEFTRRFRAQERLHNKKQTPVIGLSAHAEKDIKGGCQESGMNQVATKPIDLSLLQSILNQFVSFSDNKQVPPEFSSITLTPGKLGHDLPYTEAQLFEIDKFPLLDVENGIKGTGDENLLRSMLLMMVEQEIPKEILEIQEAFGEKNWMQLEKLAHKLKGGAVYCGVTRMIYACQYMERYQKAGHTALLNELYYQLIKVLQDTEVYLSQWLKN